MSGRLVTIEGIDGAGKTLVINRLKDDFPDAVYTQEPNDETRYGQYVRDVIADDEAPPLTVLFAFLSDHAEHVENTIRPALQNDDLVICDRYIDSRYAYQTDDLQSDVENPLEFIRSIQEEGWSRFPDLTLFIDITPEEAIRRVGGRGEEIERFEKKESLREIRENYLALADDFEDRYALIDGAQHDEVEANKDAVYQDCRDAIVDAFPEL